MVEQITGVDAQTNDEINLAVGHAGDDGGTEFEITDVRPGEAYIDYCDRDDGIWLQDNRFTRRDDWTLRVV
jgi:hypothetical protein